MEICTQMGTWREALHISVVLLICWGDIIRAFAEQPAGGGKGRAVKTEFPHVCLAGASSPGDSILSEGSRREEMKMQAFLNLFLQFLLQIVLPTHNERLISFIFFLLVREHFSSPIVNPITEGFILSAGRWLIPAGVRQGPPPTLWNEVDRAVLIQMAFLSIPWLLLWKPWLVMKDLFREGGKQIIFCKHKCVWTVIILM